MGWKVRNMTYSSVWVFIHSNWIPRDYLRVFDLDSWVHHSQNRKTNSITILCVSRNLQRDACFHPQTQYSNSNSLLWATSHTRLRAHAQYCTSSTLIGGIGGAGPSSLHTLSLRDQWCMLMQDGCKVYMDHVSWSLGLIFKNHLLEVGLTQNHETMTL